MSKKISKLTDVNNNEEVIIITYSDYCITPTGESVTEIISRLIKNYQKTQYSVMPNPSLALTNIAVQYIGESGDLFFKNNYYKCIEFENSYIWQPIYNYIIADKLSTTGTTLPEGTIVYLLNDSDVYTNIETNEYVTYYKGRQYLVVKGENGYSGWQQFIVNDGYINRVYTMPEANKALNGGLILFVGTTNETYTNGDIYRCDKISNDNYKWTKYKSLSDNNYSNEDKNNIATLQKRLVAGSNIIINNTDPENPVISSIGGGGGGGGDMYKAEYDTNNNGKVDNADNADKLGGKTPASYQKTLIAGENINIDNTDPENPVISSTGGGGGSGGDMYKDVYDTNNDGKVDNADNADNADKLGGKTPASYQKTLTAGENIIINNTDPENPVISSTGGGSSEPELYTNSTPTPITVGGWMQGSSFENKTMKQMWDGLLYPTLYPTFTNPTLSFVDNISNIIEVGVAQNITFTATFNQGTINPAYGTSGKRSGLPTQYTLTGEGLAQVVDSSALSLSRVISYTPTTAKTITWGASCKYSIGEQPLDSKGGNYSTPLAAGTKTATNITVYSVYAYYATTSNINTSTKQTLFRPTAGYYEINMVAGTATNPQFAEFHNSITINNVKAYNSVTQTWDDLSSSIIVEEVSSIGSYTKYKLVQNVGARKVRFYI